ncbi:MAG: ROK family protein [Akkermansiaceae bacterium]|jgi:fructokinase|nr:ROK family protein [Akkermansiaceae bacterium]
MIAGIELGGTKTVVAIGNPDGKLIEEFRYPTTHPKDTLTIAVEWIRQRGLPVSLGVGAFGPVMLAGRGDDYGRMLATPKPGWEGFSISAFLRTAFPDCRVVVETDVNAATLAESRCGAARGLDDVVYITIGTGIGAGILAGGRLVHGALHPEFGHLKVPRSPVDEFAGLCPFHGDCLEGLASGPAIAGRWGVDASALAPEHPAWEIQAWYLAHGVLALAAITAPSRVVIGGGVAQLRGLHERVQAEFVRLSAGYFLQAQTPDFIVPPALGQNAGIFGALLLAGGTDL